MAEYKKRPSIQSAILRKLCHPLKHNFFVDMAAPLLEEFTSNVPKDRAVRDTIDAL